MWYHLYFGNDQNEKEAHGRDHKPLPSGPVDTKKVIGLSHRDTFNRWNDTVYRISFPMPWKYVEKVRACWITEQWSAVASKFVHNGPIVIGIL